jgi:hypothetical protein
MTDIPLDSAILTPYADPPLVSNFALYIDALPTVSYWKSVSGLMIRAGGQKWTKKSSGVADDVIQGLEESITSRTPLADNPLLQMPGEQKGQIHLSRYMGPGSQLIWNWVYRYHKPKPNDPVKGTNGALALWDLNSSLFYWWDFYGIVPTMWSGPSLQAGSSTIATENLSFSFIDIEFTVKPIGS